MAKVKFCATPLVYIRVEGEKVEEGFPGQRRDDAGITTRFESFKISQGIQSQKGGLTDLGFNIGYYRPEDAEKLVEWLRSQDADEENVD